MKDQAKIKLLRMAVRQASRTFRIYEQIHLEKFECPRDRLESPARIMNKVKEYAYLAGRMDDVLKKTKGKK